MITILIHRGIHGKFGVGIHGLSVVFLGSLPFFALFVLRLSQLKLRWCPSLAIAQSLSICLVVYYLSSNGLWCAQHPHVTRALCAKLVQFKSFAASSKITFWWLTLGDLLAVHRGRVRPIPCWYLYHTWTISTIWKSSQVKCKLLPTKGRMPGVRTLLSTYRCGKAWADNQRSRGRERGYLDLSATFWKYKACFILQWLYECTWIPSRKACYIVKTLRKLFYRQICTPRYHVQNLERLTDWTNHAHRPYVIWCSYKSATHIQKKALQVCWSGEIWSSGWV